MPRIKGEYLSPEFMAAYQAALAGDAPVEATRGKAKAGTLTWLIERYRETVNFQRPTARYQTQP